MLKFPNLYFSQIKKNFKKKLWRIIVNILEYSICEMIFFQKLINDSKDICWNGQRYYTMVLIITMRVFVLMNDPPNKRILFFKLKKSS